MSATPKLISITQAAAELGYGDTSTLRRLAAQGKIPAVKVGAYWVLPEEWVREQRIKGKPIGPGGPRGKGVRGKNKKET